MALNKSIKQIAELEEQMYRDYHAKVLKLQEQLNDTPKIFKHRREQLKEEIKEAQRLENEHYNKFIDVCNDLV